MVIKYFLGRERYGISTSKSTEVFLNDFTKEPAEENPLYGTDEIERSDSETHFGVDRNCAATVDEEALMGAGTYGCSVVSAPLIAHLWSVYALPWMALALSSKAIHLKERLQRSFIRQIQYLPLMLGYLI